MKQVFIIHGGNSFSDKEAYLDHLKKSTLYYDRMKYAKRWSSQGISEALLEYDVIIPSMPNKQNAVYDEWKIIFEKLIPFFENDVQLVGHSLGAMFLAKYLHSSTLPKPVRRVVLVAGAYDDTQIEDLGSFKIGSASGIERNAKSIDLMHSKDDFVVPFHELSKFQHDLPTAVSHVFEDRGHFLQPDFPELYALLRQEKSR